MNRNDEEIYPNSPLSDVACEIRFPGEMQVECRRHLFWDQIRNDYPKIMVPHAQEGQAPALQHYRFRSEDGQRTVLVALNSLSYSETQYRGHTAFISEFSKLISIFSKTYPQIGPPKRVGWRYMNFMPFSRESGSLPLERLLKFKANLPLDLFANTVNMDMQWHGRSAEGIAVTLRLANVTHKDLLPGQEAVLLDIDSAKEADLAWDTLLKDIESMRRFGREMFESMITDDYREYLRGKTL
jgi:uncharacterized protein (TIGR04255 family)